MSLSWSSATDDTGVIGYVILQGTEPAVAIGATSTTSFVVSGLTPGTAYDFSVQALDAAGNHSTPAETTVTTASEPSSGGGCSHASPVALVLPALALWLLLARRRRA